jgi:DNA mismatch repair protein MutL
MVTVKKIFFNTPARRKFLKTVNTELGHIVDTVSRTALGQPDIQFKLIHNGRPLKQWHVVSDPGERVVDVLGAELRNRIHPISWKKEGMTLSGWIGDPLMVRKTSRHIYVYVNNRFVKDRVVQHALVAGYSQRLVKGQFPVAVLFIQVPFDQVDVNVHPAKNEVRFAAQKWVHDTVQFTVSKVLSRIDRPTWPSAGLNDQNSQKHQISEKAQGFNGFTETMSTKKSTSTQGVGWYPRDEDKPKHSEDRKLNQSSPDQAQLWERRFFSDLSVMGQIFGTYVICRSVEGLVLIDQHAAHERVLYEKMKQKKEAPGKASQRLLVPETLEFGFREARILETLIPEFKVFGLDIEPFGGQSYVIKAVPAFLSGGPVGEMIKGMVEKMISLGFSSRLEEALDESRKLLACHGAIRAGQNLTDEHIKALLKQLDACENPSHCPHGRPTWIEWKKGELEKLFKRKP